MRRSITRWAIAWALILAGGCAQPGDSSQSVETVSADIASIGQAQIPTTAPVLFQDQPPVGEPQTAVHAGAPAASSAETDDVAKSVQPVEIQPAEIQQAETQPSDSGSAGSDDSAVDSEPVASLEDATEPPAVAETTSTRSELSEVTDNQDSDPVTAVDSQAGSATQQAGPVPPGDLLSGQGDSTPSGFAEMPGRERTLTSTNYGPLGTAGTVELTLPVGSIEMIGFHEAGHPGAQRIQVHNGPVAILTLKSRSRGTDPRSAADIVVPLGQPVVAPATGTVIAAKNYVLYCEHDDQLVYIEPDGLPGWQVRVFHVQGQLPALGTRVVAGVTQIAESSRMLPFDSQVDEESAEPSWPHVHIEVVDTTVPDTRPPGPGCP